MANGPQVIADEQARQGSTPAGPGTPTECEFDVHGRTIAGLRWGTSAGAPTFALHGWLDNANTFARLAPLLPELNLLALDFAGHGRSSHRPHGVHYHSLLDIQDILAVAERLGWQRFNLIGHSMGAGIASELAGLFAERVRRAVMIDGFLGGGGASDAERIDSNRQAVERMLGASAARGLRAYADPADMVRRVTEATDQSAEAAATLVARGHKPVDGGVTWRTDPRIRFPTPLRLPENQIDELMRRTTAPSLLIIASSGDRWYLNGLEARQRAHRCLRVARLDGPHHLHLEPAHVRDVAAVVREFLELDSPAAALE